MVGTALLFPGQGSQSPGMGRDFAEASSTARDIFAQADDVLGMPISKICFEDPGDQLTRTDIQQPAIFVTSAAILAALRERDVLADSSVCAAAGLSLGEYTALYAAGSIAFEEALRLVRRRGELMQEAAEAIPSGMVSIVGGDEATVDSLCREAAEGDVLAAANFNCPGQIVISGTTQACERAAAAAGRFGVRAIPLKVAGAFHSPLMESAAVRLKDVLDSTTVSMPAYPVIANVDARPHGDAGSIRTALRRQVTDAVRWQASIEYLVSAGVSTFVEIGPGKVLSGLMRKINRDVRTINVRSVSDMEANALSTAR